MSNISVLFVGESWFVHTQEAKGFDVFTFDRYEEATEWIKAALSSDEIEFTHIPSHRVDYDFPKTLEELQKYDVIMFSDVGANTFNLSMNTFVQLQITANKLEMVKKFVENGGGFVMIGGYLTFQGIQARGCYKNTVIEEILPVELLYGDDRVEVPQGFSPNIINKNHPVLVDMPDEIWPPLLGYNRLIARPDSDVIVQNGNDPIISLRQFGKGRTCAFASDCAPHWASLQFCNWDGYTVLWRSLTKWLAGDLKPVATKTHSV